MDINYKEKIAICITTFLRDELLFKVIDSIKNNWQDNYVLLIGDQNPSEEKKTLFATNKNIYYFDLPFDCGLSYARNFLVQRASDLKIRFCWITADSITFTEKYDVESIIQFMKNDPRRGIVGLDIKNRIPWECTVELIKGKYFLLDIPNLKWTHSNEKEHRYTYVDMCRNFFIAQTDCLIKNPWDNNLKLSEHTDFFWRLKNNSVDFTAIFGTDIYEPYQVWYTDIIQGDYIGNKSKRTGRYATYRNRTGEFRELLKKKYNIKGWVSYSPSLTKVFKEWKRQNNS